MLIRQVGMYILNFDLLIANKKSITICFLNFAIGLKDTQPH